ncbi:MAG: hypothetical protein JSV78_01995, partial [Phycisphaerales bacterium]
DYWYVVGVGWNTPAAEYNYGIESGAVNYGKFTLEGGASLSKGPDVIGEQETFSPYPNSHYAMQICFQPDPGACCGVTPGDPQSCDDTLTATECLGLGGEFAGPLTTCDPNPCELDHWACCVGETCIDNLTEYQCTSTEGGVWQEGQVCAQYPCAPSGACCYRASPSDPWGCTVWPEAQCDAQPEGVYRGDGVACTEFPGCNAGACCFGDVCVPGILEVGDNSCEALGGVYQGPGSECGPGVCTPTGCCCFDDGTSISDLTEAECTSFPGGHYRGDYTDCATVEPPCGDGACCAFDFGGCVDEMGESLCENTLNGTWQGEGTQCATLSPRCPGTCCWGTDQCNGAGGAPVTPEDCTALPDGVFMGYEVECSAGLCPASTSGACCFVGGDCVVTTSLNLCTAVLGGFSWLPGGDCSAGCPACQGPEDCDDGDLCTIDTCTDGTCDFDPITSEDCSDGVSCTDDFCNQATGTCVNTDNCLQDGSFCNGVESCDPGLDTCVSSGFPCLPEEICDEVLGCVECVGAVDCEDGLSCTDDVCDPVDHVCSNPDNCIEDGLFCNGVEYCDGGVGDCVSPGNPCPPETPICDEALGCVECLDVGDCDDAVACTDDDCVDYACSNTPNDTNCPPETPICDAVLGCVECLIDEDCDTGEICDASHSCVVENFCMTLVEPPLCMGDGNGDGVVDPTDVGLAKYYYASTEEEAICRYDINCDGTIDPVDVGLIKYYYGVICNPDDPNHEPPCWWPDGG